MRANSISFFLAACDAVTELIDHFGWSVTRMSVVLIIVTSTVSIECWVKVLRKVLRLHIATVDSLFERWNEGCGIFADIQAPETGLIDDIKFL